MVRKIVLLQVLVNHAVGPVDDRLDLRDALLQLEHADFLARLRLLAAQAGDPALDVQFADRPLHRLDLVDLVVAFDAFDAMLPHLAMPGLEPRSADLSAVDLEVQLEPLGQLIGEAIGLGKEIAGIDHDHGDVGPLLRHHVKQNGGLHPKAGRQHGVGLETLERPAHPLFSRDFFQAGADFAERSFLRLGLKLRQVE